MSAKTFVIQENMDTLIIESINKKLDKLKLEQISSLAKELNVEPDKLKANGKSQKKNKKELLQDIMEAFKTLSCQQIKDVVKKIKMGFELEVKNILSKSVDIDDLIESGVCLTLDKFLQENPSINTLFTNKCDLVNINNTIKSENCPQFEVQGLYILTISKNNIDYIVKLGSFAESQGMYKRICSFGGGNYETGSLTNKWFQEFIKRALNAGYTSKFTYYNKIQEKILIDNLDGGKVEMTPYVMRPLETELFKKYNNTNDNIPPIFGSNCL
jgi:hypothetical protein